MNDTILFEIKDNKENNESSFLYITGKPSSYTPVETFESILEYSDNKEALINSLSCLKYPSDSHSHKAGDKVFKIVSMCAVKELNISFKVNCHWEMINNVSVPVWKSQVVPPRELKQLQPDVAMKMFLSHYPVCVYRNDHTICLISDDGVTSFLRCMVKAIDNNEPFVNLPAKVVDNG
jgi:hypothetical protein